MGERKYTPFQIEVIIYIYNGFNEIDCVLKSVTKNKFNRLIRRKGH